MLVLLPYTPVTSDSALGYSERGVMKQPRKPYVEARAGDNVRQLHRKISRKQKGRKKLEEIEKDEVRVHVAEGL